MKFISGMQLCEKFFNDIVKPMLATKYPEINYSAAKIDQGSDVLGYDTEMSMDHGWGLKVMIFLDEADNKKYHEELQNYFAYNLPFEYKGFSTHFADIENRDSGYMANNNDFPIKHRIMIHTIDSFFNEYLGFNPVSEISETNWLTAPNQALLTIFRGKVFHDGLDKLNMVKQKLKWYPDDIWLYLLACQWRKIEQEEPFMARCGIVDDEIGSRLVASRMINEIMKMCFLMERQYYPYYKWFGTAFNELKCGKKYNKIFINIFNAADWKVREKCLSRAYEELAKMHNELNITEKMPESVSSFHNRPIKVIHGDIFNDAIMKKVSSKRLKSMKRKIGSIDQHVDSTDMLCWTEKRKKLEFLYMEEKQNVMENFNIEAERLIIRRHKESDYADLHEYLSDPAIYEYEPGEPVNIDQAKELAAERAKGTDFLAVELKESGKMIGHLYFKQVDHPANRTWALGYIFNPKYHRKGYASEAARALVEYAFKNLNAHRIMAGCDPNNPASWKLLENIGFRREGHFKKRATFRNDKAGNPIWHDAYEYGILEEDLPNQK